MLGMRNILAALILPLALTGCGDDKGSSESPVVAETNSRYSSVEDLRDAAIEAGYDCRNWKQDNVVDLAAESGHCSDADVFMVFATDSDLAAQVSTLRELNEMSRDYGIDPDVNLVGPNWIIQNEAADELADDLGGTILR